MKLLRKRIVAVMCVVAMLAGIVFQNGIVLDTKAADADATATTEGATREWWVYGDDTADTGLVVTDTANGVTSGSITDAGVNLPEGLIESNMELQIKLTVEGESDAITTLNSKKSNFEIANVRSDCAELSWTYANLVSGENNISFAFKDASHTNGSVVNGKAVQDNKNPFDWEETINFFRFYHTASLSATLKITVNEIKIVYTDAGLTFGDNDTYLQLSDAMETTPESVEATVNMPTSAAKGSGWVLRAGSDTSKNSGSTLTTGVTTATDAPGAGYTYSIWDATSAQTTWTTANTGLGIDVGEYGMSDLAVSFWAYSNEEGTLTNQGDNQLRISTNASSIGSNFIYYKIRNIEVKQGWNYIEIPLDTSIDNVGWLTSGTFDLTAGIQSVGFASFILDQGSVRYLTDIRLIVLEEEEATGEWTLRAGSDTSKNSGSTLTTGVTTASDAPGAGYTYSIWDATSAQTTWTTANTGLEINVGSYGMSDLAVSFWAYSNEDGTLTNQGDNQLRISTNTSGVGSNFIYYKIRNIQVKQGWNYIEIPLDANIDNVGWLTSGTFDLSVGIQSVGFASFILDQGSVRYLTDIKLIVLEEETSGEWTLRAGSDTSKNSGSTLTTGVTTSSDAPGAGLAYSIWDATSAQTTWTTANTGLGINVGNYGLSDLAVSFWAYSNEDGTLTNQGDNQLRISTNTSGIGSNFIYYKIRNIQVKQGWNYIEIPLDTNISNVGWLTSGTFDLSVGIQSVGFASFILDQGSVRYLTDIKLIVLEDDAASSWTLVDQNTTYTNNYGLIYTPGTVSAGSEPAAGTTYARVDVSAYSSSVTNSGKFGIEFAMDAFDVSANPSDYAVGFWFYTSTGVIPNGQIELNSSGATSETAEIRWLPQNLNVQPGWNYIALNIGAPEGKTGTIDYSNINFFRWYSDTGAETIQATVFAITDIELIKADSSAVVKTIRTADNMTWKHGLTTTALCTMQEGPTVGTKYMETSIASGKGVNFYTTLDAIDASAYELSNLSLVFWVYVSTGTLQNGQLELTSGGKGDIEEISWTPHRWNSSLQIGWNKMVLPLDSCRYITTSDSGIQDIENKSIYDYNYTFDTSAIDYIRWYSDTMVASDTTFRISEVVLYAENVDEGDIAVTQNVTSTSGNYMIFSNANVAGENSPFALFVTTDGYPAVLYGTTQFVLKQNICTGKDVTVKVARNSDGAIEFYIDGELAGTSKTTVNTLSTPTNPYSIGADGVGGQTFVGTMKDVKVYSDASAATCIGNWPLIGDIRYVVETMPDISGNSNHASFKGSRADDWYDVEEIADDEWSMVFIPDMTSRFNVKDYSTWYKMSKWIGNNVDTENIQYVIGDKLSNTDQKTFSENGFEYFDNRVSTSNLTGCDNGYYRFQVGDGVKWMVLTLKNESNGTVSDATVEWAKGIMEQYPYDNVIVTCHTYTRPMWQSISSYNVKLILSGTNGNTVDEGVPAMILPAQNDTESSYFEEQSLGLLYMLRFSNGGTTVTACSYSPIYDKYFDESANSTQAITTVKAPETYYGEVTTATAGTAPENVPAGYKFAGWFTEVDTDLVNDADGNGEYDDSVALAAGTTGTAQAKFVDADLLGVRGQIKAGTTDKSNYSDIRFVTSVDRLNYKRMGFDITYGGATINVESKYVYQKLYAVGDSGGETLEYTPKEVFSPSATYFKAYTLTNVPNRAFSEDFTVQTYWITLDGTKVYGEAVDKNVWMGYPTNEESLPKVVNTTYETDDVVVAEIVVTEEKYGYLDDVVVDESGNKDWTVAIQNALNDCYNMGGGTVYLPKGTYNISDSITIPSYVTLRGDWQDPDVELEDGETLQYGTIFNVYTEEITANRNQDSVHNNDTAAFELSSSSGIIGITVYYPEQSLDDVQTYPYTFYVPVDNDGGMLITLKNITVINGYRGIGTRYEKQHEALIVDNFKGTFLDCGMALYNASEVGRITGVSISSKYWKGYTANPVDASTYVLANATGMELGDLQWEEFSNCSVDGYNTGISVVAGYRINFVGSMIDMNITGCTTGITIAEKNDDTYYAGDYTDKGVWPHNSAMDSRWGTVVARSTIEGNVVNNTQSVKGNDALFYQKILQKSALLRMTDVAYDSSKVSAQDYTGTRSNFDQNVQSTTEDLGDVGDDSAQYDSYYTVTAAQKKNLWVVDLEEYDAADVDVSSYINEAMQNVLARNGDGGIVYIPGGTYRLDNPITVPEGVELRGVSAVANRELNNACEGTLFMCYYGDDSSSTASDQALITLAGSNTGVNGIRFMYPENINTNTVNGDGLESTYIISAAGTTDEPLNNVHIVNCSLVTSSYGVNLANCDDFYIEGIFGCVYKNMFNVNGDGIIRGCWSNQSALVRACAEGLPEYWPGESDTSMTELKYSLMTDLTLIKVTGGNVLIQDILGYAINTLISSENATTVAINTNADAVNSEGSHFYLAGGTLTAINAMRASLTTAGVAAEAACVKNAGGTLNIYNYIQVERTNANTAYRENYIGNTSETIE